MKKIDKDMTIGQVIELDEKAGIILEGFGMHCTHCPFSQMETLEQASEVHKIDLKLMLEKLNELLVNKK